MADLTPIQEIVARKQTKKAYIFTHDNPDPDALASACAFQLLLKTGFGVSSRIVYGGLILRDENVEMVRLLKIRLSLVDRIKIKKNALFILVDTQPHSGNNSFPGTIFPDIVIDHHPEFKKSKAHVADIREDVGACSTIICDYLSALNIDVPAAVATALFYGISSETQQLGREVSPLDKKYYLELFPKVSQRILSKIEHPKRSRAFFTFLGQAIENSRVHKNIIVSHIDQVPYPDLIAQFCDFLLSLEKVSWAFCYGLYQDRIIFSIRTLNRKAHAGVLAARMVKHIGKAGGHGMIAGGWIRLLQNDVRASEEELLKRFLHAYGVHGDVSFTPLSSAATPADTQEPKE
ncbi:MAG: bifunctional oligoribonuclease/PAP phosphatase NrnA [Candidatus Omnitrophica bacterium]|nr:bifunctional oligoribonuclease/PAP phosphatase NrnA [Candidatus Omnitrophota bacterium]